MSHSWGSPRVGLCAIIWFALICAIGQADVGRAKVLGFRDPNTNYLYKLTSHNASRPAQETSYRSYIKVTRVKLDESNRQTGAPEHIQTLKFTPALVDFDTHCSPSHCYLVTVTGRSSRNVELFSWQRTQFDLSAVKDSFARPFAVKLISINSGFYIAIAQRQLHLSPHRYSPAASDDEEPTRFMGSAVLKFLRGHEHDIKYHQFIRLPFHPRHVNHFTTVNSNNMTDYRTINGPAHNHHLVFSAVPNWTEPEAESVRSFIWSPINDYFWPYRMPRGAEVVQTRPGTQVIRFPEMQQATPLNLTQGQFRQQEYISSVETCFYQLQRVLADRDLEARRLLESSKTIWRAPEEMGASYAPAGLTNISAQVIVHGNVFVSGSIIDNPQISLIESGQWQRPQQPNISVAQVVQRANSLSPAIVENKLKRAHYNLEYIRDKISRAVLTDVSDGPFRSQIQFFAPIEAAEVVFNGVANSDVRLNGIPFRQLENELVSLNGPQSIIGNVIFDGKVVADRLEVHALINDNYFLKDAIDITSDKIQVIEATSQGYATQATRFSGLEFRSVSTPEVVLAYNATFNSIRLSDMITRDNRTQVVVGRKSFRRLSMAKLDLAHPGVQLNDMNISRIARNAIRLRPDQQSPMYRTILGGHSTTFLRPISVNKLVINGIINQHINLTSLIHDSIKTNDYEVQQIFGQKNFLNGLKVKRLNTEGALNGIEVSQIFNLNSAPPTSELLRSTNSSPAYSTPYDVPITGEFRFLMPGKVLGNVSAKLVNGVDLARRAVRRSPYGQDQGLPPQIVRGRKTFYRPLRVINDIRLVDVQQVSRMLNNASGIPYPLVNGIDMRLVSSGLARHMKQPPPIFVENLEIRGNLDFPALVDRDGSLATSFGNYSSCPLDLIRQRVVLAGVEEQFINTPIKINSLRAKTVLVDPGALNGYDFSDDFVLRTGNATSAASIVEPIFGVKTFDHLIVSPSMVMLDPLRYSQHVDGRHRGIVLDRGASINQVPYSELQTFIAHERNMNSTGEKIYSTMNVYGNLISKRINGYSWPNDILRRSAIANPGDPSLSFNHKRIYSPLIFTNISNLRVLNQLVLRGPIQLNGRLNGVNLTEFSRQSATYGDKDLYSNGRPIRNKIFAGGLTVRNNIRSQGQINGVDIEEMQRRVVTTHQTGQPVHITSSKIFTDVSFAGPVRMLYLNDIPMDSYLSRIRFEPDGSTIRVNNKKTITGALRISKNLFVRGLINGIDFIDLRARAISLAPTDRELTFNKTLIVEGDVYMDNLWIDQHNGTIDGVRLKNLIELGPLGNNEFALSDYHVSLDPHGRPARIDGSLMDCNIACDLQPLYQYQQRQQQQQVRPYPSGARSMSLQPEVVGPVVIPTLAVLSTLRPAMYGHNNFTITRTTPPYSLASSFQPPLKQTPRPVLPRPPLPQLVDPMQMHQLVKRRPVSVRYESSRPAPGRHHKPSGPDALVAEQLEQLRQKIVSINLSRLSRDSNLIIGFIDSPTNDLSNNTMQETDLSHLEHSFKHNMLFLDEIDFPFTTPTMYHLIVGVAIGGRTGQNVTKVVSSLSGGSPRELSVLPVEAPNSAMFVNHNRGGALFLFVSQDQSTKSRACLTTEMMHSSYGYSLNGYQHAEALYRADDGVHVYLFHALENSSSLRSAYFDLHQTINLPAVDGFRQFHYGGSTYVLAISRAIGRIHLLILRGYTGFQLVSHVDVNLIEDVKIMIKDERPMLVIRQGDGNYRVMEAVVI